MPSDTLWNLDVHTQVKHNIYDGYLKAWFPIILQSRHFGSATYAEGYAGPGEYCRGEPGSPIYALRRLLAARTMVNPAGAACPVRFVFIDKRADRVAHLINRVEAELDVRLSHGRYIDRDRTLTILIGQGDCERDLPHALTDVGAWNAPILAVLDSFGGGCTQDLLRRFARNKAGEVLTTTDPQHFVRELDPERADRVFGSRAWREVADQPADRKREFVARCLDGAARAAGFCHVVPFELHTARGGELILQFGTNHPTGLERFKNSLWKADPVAGASVVDPNHRDQVALPLGFEPNLTQLDAILHQYLSRRPEHTATLGDLRNYTLDYTTFKRAHAAQAAEELRQQGRIQTRSLIQPRSPDRTRVTALPEHDPLPGV